MAKKDYYEILGVKRTDSSEAIKNNYKKLALKFHPDKASEDKKKEYEESFKEINEAYGTLGDEVKRKRYDLGGGPSQFNQGQGFHGGNFSDILIDLLRNGSFGGQFSEDEDSNTGQDLRYELTIEFKEAVFGCEKEVLIKKEISCKACGGSGAEDDEFNSCPKCNGHGQLKINRRTPFGVISQAIRCDNCIGEGKIIKNKCLHCKGNGTLSSKEKVKIKIPAGIDNGQILRVQGGGDAIKNGSEGDLFLSIRVRPHKIFKRDGFNIYMDLAISFSQAALGGEINIPTLSQEEVKIKIEKGTESGSILRLKGKGISILNSPSHSGDQFVNITIKTPKKLSRAQIQLFEELAKLDE